ncbi:DUF3618 domain-containing protein [Kitasatospora sp. NPDC085879]|uniref:DUF3618 domain-containing protein n=1 Tax=Kitasatospora sp. NPDC085879 TaxID=3154769 RepID=UPI00342B4774
MGATPDELRTEVEARRAHLARSVDRLADRVTPSRVAHRKADAARSRVTGIKERVMGTAHDTGASTHRAAAAGTAESVGATAKDTATQIGDGLQPPAKLRRQTQGSPLAAGIMAFGAGLLAAALLPASAAERAAGRCCANTRSCWSRPSRPPSTRLRRSATNCANPPLRQCSPCGPPHRTLQTTPRAPQRPPGSAPSTT